MHGPSPKGSPWHCQAILLWPLMLSPSFPPGGYFTFFPLLLPRPSSYPHFQLPHSPPISNYPSLSADAFVPLFNWEKIASDCISERPQTPQPHPLKYLSLNSALTSLSMDLLSFPKANLFIWISHPILLLPSHEHCSNVSLSTASTIFPFLLNHPHQHAKIL